MAAVFAGMIVIWHGLIADIPEGWRLCDGSHQTPNLRDRFIVGAGDTYDPDDTGGSINHNHPFTGDGHRHNLDPGVLFGGGSNYDFVTTTDPAIGTTDNASTLPPYYALAYIMKT